MFATTFVPDQRLMCADGGRTILGGDVGLRHHRSGAARTRRGAGAGAVEAGRVLVGSRPEGSAGPTCRRSSACATRSSTATASRAIRCTRWWARWSAGSCPRARGSSAGPRATRARGALRRPGRRDPGLGDEFTDVEATVDAAAVHGAAAARPDPRVAGKRAAVIGLGLDRAAVQPRAEGARRGRSPGVDRVDRADVADGVRGRRGRPRTTPPRWAERRRSTSSSRPSAITPARWRPRSARSPTTARAGIRRPRRDPLRVPVHARSSASTRR